MIPDPLSKRITRHLKALPHASEAQRYQILRHILTQLDPSNNLATCCDDPLLARCIREFRKWGGDNVTETLQAFSLQRNNIRRIRRSLSLIQDPSIPLCQISFTCDLFSTTGKLHAHLKVIAPPLLNDLQIERERQAMIGWRGFFPFLTHLLGHFSQSHDLITLRSLIESVAWSLNTHNDTQRVWGLFLHQNQGLTEPIYLSFFEDGMGEDTFLSTPITASEGGEHLKASLKRARWAAARYLRQLTTDFDATSLMSYDMLLKIGDHYHAAGFEGGSLSLPVATMLVAHALQLSMPKHVALTGDIDSDALVQPVNGVSQKVRAAIGSELTCIIIPAGNMMDTRHIPVEGLEIFGVRSLEDACNYLFRDALRDGGYQAFPIEAASTSTFTPFAGRRHELVRLQQEINKTLSGQGGLTIVHGDAGVGKTRLLEEIRQYALDEGLFVLTGACLYRQAIPYWPFIDALMSIDDRDRRLAGKEWPEKVSVIKTLLKNTDGLDARILQVQLFDQLLGLAEILTDTAGAVFCIEDLQWSDSSTLELVHHLARQAQHRRFRLVITYRSEETVREDQQAETYFLDVLQQCGTEGLSSTLALNPLNESDCGTLVAVLVRDRAIPAWFSDRVYKETQGNPLFIIELIKWWKDQGLIKNGWVGIDWQVFEDQQIIPPRIQDVIAHRLRPLTDEERTLLDIAATAGEQFDITDVLAIGGGDRIKTLQFVQRLEKKHGILKHKHRNIYQFAHSKIQEYIYSNQSEILRNEYHRLWARILLIRKDNGEDVPIERLAVHLYQGDDRQAALPYLMEAGERAQQMCAFREARWYWEHAKNILEIQRGYKKENLTEVLLNIARIYYQLGIMSLAKDSNQRALELCKDLQMFSLQGRALLQLGAISLVESKLDEARKLFEQGIDMYNKAKGRKGLAVGLNYLGKIAYQQSLWEVANKHFQESYSIISEINDVIEISPLTTNIGLVYLAMGNYKSALTYFAKSIHRDGKHSNIQHTAIAKGNIGMAYEGMENWQKSMKAHMESVKLYERMGNLQHLWNGYINFSRVSARLGDIIIAEENLKKGKEILNILGSKRGMAEAKRVGGLIESLRGQWNEACILFDESETLCKATSDLQGSADTLRERAYMFIKKGERNRALGLLEQAKEAFNNIDAKGDVSLVMRKMEMLKNVY